MWWLVRRDREQFTGCIAGLGTASGHRVVIGHWARSPYGVVTDVMVEDPVGHRTLYAPTRQLAAFLTASYRFDQVQVVPCRARRSGPDWTVQAGPLQVSFTTGRRNLLGWLLLAIPDAVARRPWWVGLLDLPARRLLPGVRTRGHTQDGRRQWYGAQDLRAIIAVDATLEGRGLGALRAVRPPVGFGFGSVPSRPSLVHLTTTIEAVRPGTDGDAARIPPPSIPTRFERILIMEPPGTAVRNAVSPGHARPSGRDSRGRCVALPSGPWYHPSPT
jgi:hypothetical protein